MNTKRGIKLNGVYRENEDLVSFCKKELLNNTIPQWLQNVYLFVLEWMNDSDYTEAHTSGSTGNPKLIRLYKKHMIASAVKTNSYFNLTCEKVALLCLPANYIAGKMMLVRAFVGGFNLVLKEPTGNPLNNIKETIDFAAMVPMQIKQCINSILSGDKIDNVIIGGGALSEELRSELVKAKTNCYETYGMTETVSHVAICKVGEAVFKAMPHVIFHVDSRGCLVVNAPDIVSSEIVTNDIVELINGTEFKWLGRFDNVINSGGVKLFPEEIEKKLSRNLNIPFVVSSIKDELLGEKVVLVIEEGNDVVKLYSILMQDDTLSKYERPKEILAIPSFPYTETNKIKREEVKKLIGTL